MNKRERIDALIEAVGIDEVYQYLTLRFFGCEYLLEPYTGPKVARDLSTEENRAFWRSVTDGSAKVRGWIRWATQTDTGEKP
jgi:hypothetical protein